MTLQMHVLTLRETGHVLAAVARAASGPNPEVAALVGADLPVAVPRNQGDPGPAVAIPVPADLIEVKALVYDPAVLAHPLAHILDGGRVTTVPVPGVPRPPSPLTPAKVTVNAGVAEVPVVVVIVGKDDPAIRRAESGKVPAAATQVELTHTILPGESPAGIPAGKAYYLLIAEGGTRLRLEVANS